MLIAGSLLSLGLTSPSRTYFFILQGSVVGGIINTDTVWNVEQSPVTLGTDVQIAPSVTLTISPGVVVYGMGKSIKVWGTLNAAGNITQTITFSNTHIAPGKNGSSTNPFLIRVQHAEVLGGSLYAPTGEAVYGRLELQDSLLNNLMSYFYLWYPTGDCLIERNVFLNSGGISAGASGGVKVYVTNNLFSNWVGLYGMDAAVVNWAAYNGSDMIVKHNSFLDTGRIAVALQYSSSMMNAAENYWGTTNVAAVPAMILDRNDDLSITGYISYTPILTAPHPLTPNMTVIPIPTVTPTVTASPTATSTPAPMPIVYTHFIHVPLIRR